MSNAYNAWADVDGDGHDEHKAVLPELTQSPSPKAVTGFKTSLTPRKSLKYDQVNDNLDAVFANLLVPNALEVPDWNERQTHDLPEIPITSDEVQPRTPSPVVETESQPRATQYTINVSDPQKKGSATSSYVAYMVQTEVQTRDKSEVTRNYSVVRRFNDFFWLSQRLAESYPGAIVPAIPEKQALGKFDDDFIAHRKIGLQRFIQKVGLHPIFQQDKDFHAFIQDADISGRIKDRIAPGNGFLSGLLTPRFIETDEWFVHVQEDLNRRESAYRALLKGWEDMSKQKKEAQEFSLELQRALVDLARVPRLSPNLAKSSEHMSRLLERAMHSESELDKMDALGLHMEIDEAVRLVASVRRALEGRVNLSRKETEADLNVRRIKMSMSTTYVNNLAKAEAIQQGAEELSNAESRLFELQMQVREATMLVKREYERVGDMEASDLHAAFEKHVQQHLEYRLAMQTAWQEFHDNLQNLLNR